MKLGCAAKSTRQQIKARMWRCTSAIARLMITELVIIIGFQNFDLMRNHCIAEFRVFTFDVLNVCEGSYQLVLLKISSKQN